MYGGGGDSYRLGKAKRITIRLKWMSRWRKKADDKEVEITKGSREFHNKTVDGRNDASRRDLLQTGKAKDFGLRNE